MTSTSAAQPPGHVRHRRAPPPDRAGLAAPSVGVARSGQELVDINAAVAVATAPGGRSGTAAIAAETYRTSADRAHARRTRTSGDTRHRPTSSYPRMATNSRAR